MSDLLSSLQTSLGNAYAFERELGGGGMSRVFVAEEHRLRRKVVVKVLSSELAQGLSVDRFEREIQTAAALQQANIVPVLSAGDSNGLPYYTMPFVEGESLRARLARGPLGISEAIGVLRDVSKALAYAHGHGVVHRDIKPDNVLISGGTAVVTDFGIAKAIAAAQRGDRPEGGSPRDPSIAALTAMGTSIGTPAYMAPEQAAGDPDVDHRADIYSLGATAYELLTGQPVFAGRTPQRMLVAHMSEVPRPIGELRADVPAPLVSLVMSCLAKDAQDRPQQAADMARMLEAITSGSGMDAMPPVLLERGMELPKALALYAVAFVAVAVLAKAAIVGVGLPDWVFPASLIVMALGLPAILWTAYVQRVTRRAMITTPTFTPGGTPSTTRGAIATIAMRASPHVSWKRTWKAGAMSVAAFVIVVGVVMVLRSFGIGPAASLLAAGQFSADEPLVVADFAVSGGADSSLGSTVAEAVKQDLLQSDLVRLASVADISGALQLMQRPPSTKLAADVAREVALRLRGRAVVGGSVQQVGAGYLVTLNLTSADSGTTLATYSAGADSPKELISTIGSLSRKLRARLGESLQRVQSGPPLEEVSTTSIDALRAYSEASQLLITGNRADGMRALQRAVSLDSNFAAAYRRIAAELVSAGGQRAEMLRNLERAYALRERLPFLDRYMVEGSWWRIGPARNTANAVRAYETLLAVRPNYFGALNNLGNTYNDMGEFARAEQVYRKALKLREAGLIPATNLVNALLLQGKTDEAQHLADSARGPTAAGQEVQGRLALALLAGDKDDSAEVVIKQTMASPTASPNTRDFVARVGTTLAWRRGQVAEGIRMALAVRDARARRGAPAAPIEFEIQRATMDLLVREHRESALARLDSLVASGSIDSLEAADRPNFELALLAAFAGRTAVARKAVADAEAEQPWGPENPTQHGLIRTMRGAVAMAEQRDNDALTELRSAARGSLIGHEAATMIAMIHDRAGRADSAIANFELALSVPSADYDKGRYFGAIPFRLGELYESKGDLQRAASAYTRFIERWKRADPELQPRVDEAKRRLARLQQRIPS